MDNNNGYCTATWDIEERATNCKGNKQRRETEEDFFEVCERIKEMNTLHLWDGYPHTNPELADDVKSLQKALDLVEDGRFGPYTDTTVRSYQKGKGLVVDGIVGAKTWATFPVILATPNPEVPRLEQCYRLFKAKYENIVVEACQSYHLFKDHIFGIGVRESDWGDDLDDFGTGDYCGRHPNDLRSGNLPPDGHGFGRGLMQIDWDAHEFARTGNWNDPSANINYGCKVLGENYQYLQGQVVPLKRAVIAGYNCGCGNVQTALRKGNDVDYFTTGRNYSTKVLEYANWFVERDKRYSCQIV